MSESSWHEKYIGFFQPTHKKKKDDISVWASNDGTVNIRCGMSWSLRLTRIEAANFVALLEIGREKSGEMELERLR